MTLVLALALFESVAHLLPALRVNVTPSVEVGAAERTAYSPPATSVAVIDPLPVAAFKIVACVESATAVIVVLAGILVPVIPRPMSSVGVKRAEPATMLVVPFNVTLPVVSLLTTEAMVVLSGIFGPVM